MRAVDQERIMIGKKLGVEVIDDARLGVMQGYMTEDNYEYGYANAPGFKGIKAQSQLDYRYINEDVGYGLVFMSDLAKRVGVEIPMIDAMINIASAAMGRDYRKEAARTWTALDIPLRIFSRKNINHYSYS